MKKSVDELELQCCICLLCEEAFFIRACDQRICCPKCGNGQREALLFESDEEEERSADQSGSLSVSG